MVIGIIGENCSGKSTLAGEIKKVLGGEVITGKDYLRMAKSEEEAASLFRKRLDQALMSVLHIKYGVLRLRRSLTPWQIWLQLTLNGVA